MANSETRGEADEKRRRLASTETFGKVSGKPIIQ
jgi:hypothetical protein